MSFKKLEEFIEIAKKNDASHLEYESGKDKFSVSFGKAAVNVAPQMIQPQVATSSPVAPVSQSSSVHPTVEDNGKAVKSPFVGTFYRSSSPETEAFVKVGDTVSKGQVLCIVEAMKIMNEIESDFDGVIAEICVENENYVEFGQPLFKLK